MHMVETDVFANALPTDAPLPATLTIPVGHELYFGRVLHANRNHYQQPLSRRPAPFRHDHFHIVLVIGGECTFCIDGRECPAQAGDVFLTSPSISHHFANVGSGDARYAEITFDFVTRRGRLLRYQFNKMLEAWTKQPCPSITSTKAPAGFTAKFRTAIDVLVSRGLSRGQPLTSLELSESLWSILAMTYRHLFQMPGTPQPQSLDAIRDHIRVHYRESLSLESLASQAGVSPNHLSRRFKQLYGCTPIHYQIDLRMRDACALLKAGDQTLQQIATAIGFGDEYYFARLFRRRIGVAPGRYRMADR